MRDRVREAARRASPQHSSDGEAWRQGGGQVLQRVDHQVDPEGRRHTVTSGLHMHLHSTLHVHLYTL